jgi:hypothetical protein
MYIFYKIYLQWIYSTLFFLSHVVSKIFASEPPEGRRKRSGAATTVVVRKKVTNYVPPSTLRCHRALEDAPIALPPHPPTLGELTLWYTHFTCGRVGGVIKQAGVWLHGFANICKGPQSVRGRAGTGVLHRSIMCLLLSMHQFCRRWPPERLRKICCEGSTRFLTFLQTAFGWIYI